jgi:hypothetical protein
MLDEWKAAWVFANFDVARPLDGVVTWEDNVVDEGLQRELLYRPLEETSQYAAQLKELSNCGDLATVVPGQQYSYQLGRENIYLYG